MLVGFGYDSHRLAAGRKLILAGVEIPAPQGTLAHSDGDVLAHALADALLGATGKGNIGLKFPDSDPRYKDISSLELLNQLVAELQVEIINLDATLVLDTPRLNPFLDQMKAGLSKILQTDKISLKPKTSEGSQPDLVCAYVVVLVKNV